MNTNFYMLCVALIGSIACGAFIGLIWGAIVIKQDSNRFNWRAAFLFGGTTFAACFGAVWWVLK
jgi:hypothetical protein